jgi:hypothetical protein
MATAQLYTGIVRSLMIALRVLELNTNPTLKSGKESHLTFCRAPIAGQKIIENV